MFNPKDCRRRFIRFPVHQPIWWSNGWESVPVIVRNISAGGMLCEFPRQMAPNTKINLELDLPGLEEMVLCRAKVVHCRPGENDHFLVGLAFIELEGVNPVELVRRLIKDSFEKQF